MPGTSASFAPPLHATGCSAKKEVWERRSHASPPHYTPALG